MKVIQQFIIEKSPRLGAALYAFKHSKDGDYYRKAMQTDPSVFQFHDLGKLNPDKNIYFIRMGDSGDGFFAEYNRLLMYLYTADKYHFAPVIEFTDGFLYSEKEPVNGYSNPFQYYFLEPSGIDPEEAKKSRNVVYSAYVHTLQEEMMAEKKGIYGFTEEYINMLGRINREYIKMNPVVNAYINENISSMSDGRDPERMIGVHFRGTDYRIGLDGHPVYMTPDRMIRKAKELMESSDYDTVFLATDDAGALQEFKTAFGESLRYYNDVYRSDKNTSVAFSEDGRKNHHYLLGLEVLRDMETLAGCGALIAGISQVSLAARIRKEGKKEKYKDLIIIDPGIVKNGLSQDKFIQKAGKVES